MSGRFACGPPILLGLGHFAVLLRQHPIGHDMRQRGLELVLESRDDVRLAVGDDRKLARDVRPPFRA